MSDSTICKWKELLSKKSSGENTTSSTSPEQSTFVPSCRTIQDTTSTGLSGNKSAPVSTFAFQKPDESCFIHDYVPREPLNLLTNHLQTSKSLESVRYILGAFVPSGATIEDRTSTGLSWGGTFWKDGNWSKYRVCIYKSKKNPDNYTIEVQQDEHSGNPFLFGEYYNSLKRSLN